jgi:opacity protein-like surface antigen
VAPAVMLAVARPGFNTGVNVMRLKSISILAAACCLLSAGASAQSRDVGWEFGAELIYQNSQDVDFDGGTTVEFDSDLGISLSAGYRFSDHLEVQFGVDWTNVDYDVGFQSATTPGLTFDATGEIEQFTPFIRANFNFVDGPITPYVTGGIGYSFIDTNIPDGPPQTGCWWDPWYGQICTTFQSTATTEEFTYNAGLGVRWDLSTGYSLRLAYEKHWYDLDNASADFDQFKLGFVMRY